MLHSAWAPAQIRSHARTPGLCADSRGAVFVEFLIAFFPLLLAFLALLQLAFVSAARLVLDHAAISATRAAIVILPDDPAQYGGAAVSVATGQRLEDIRAAARVPLLLFEADPRPNVTLLSGGGGDANGVVRLKLEYDYPCRVPVGGAIACALGGGRARLTAEAALPNQGAGYAY